MTEASCAEPASIHGAMHLAREVALRQSLPNIPQAVVRPTLIYGAGDPHNGYGPNRFLRLALKTEPIVLAGQGEERRDHIHVDDVGGIIARCVQHAATGVVNAVSGSVISFRDIAEFIVGLTGSSSPITSTVRTGPMPHNGYRAFDAAQLARSFPDLPLTGIRDGLKRTLATTANLLPL
jgi:UDP-glucose 4-epimerase